MTSDLGAPVDLLVHGVKGCQLVVQDVGGHLSDVGLVQVPAHPLHLPQQPGLVETQGEVTSDHKTLTTPAMFDRVTDSDSHHAPGLSPGPAP